MATILSILDFRYGETKVPKAVSQNAGEEGNQDLKELIEKYEPQILMEFFTDADYAVFVTKIGDKDAEQYWLDLINGSGKWLGLKPLLKYYIFCKWLEFDDVKLTVVGAGKGKAKSFTRASVSGKYTSRWNDFVDQACCLEEYLRGQDDIEITCNFPKYEYVSCYFGHPSDTGYI
jgi:hypothetical protein